MTMDDFNLSDSETDVTELDPIITPPKPAPLTDAERKDKKKRLEELLEKKRMREEYFDELLCKENI